MSFFLYYGGFFLRFFFFFFFFVSFMVGGWVGLARDGCLVRSLVGVTQWGWRVAQRGFCGRLLQKQPPTTTAGRLWGVAFEATDFLFKLISNHS